MFKEEELNKIKEEIAGEIIFAHDISAILKKWRNIFEISQKKMAKEIGIKASTLSDYENGRRQNPGINIISRFVDTLIKIDIDRNNHILKSLIKTENKKPFITKEFKNIKKITDFESFMLKQVNYKKINEKIFGLTIIDTIDIKDLDFKTYPLLFGKTNKRMFYFTKTTELIIIEYTLKILKFLTNQQPIAIILKWDEEELPVLNINIPFYITELNKEEILSKLGELK